jgi:hypothetical protein
MTVAEGVARQASSQGIGSIGGNVAKTLIERATAENHREGSRAA